MGDKSSGSEIDVATAGGIGSLGGIVTGVLARGCDARRIAAVLFLLATADAGLVVLLLCEAAELVSLALCFERLSLLQLRIAAGSMTGSGSRGRNNGEQCIRDMLGVFSSLVKAALSPRLAGVSFSGQGTT